LNCKKPKEKEKESSAPREINNKAVNKQHYSIHATTLRKEILK
jgi:hypothetical protein